MHSWVVITNKREKESRDLITGKHRIEWSLIEINKYEDGTYEEEYKDSKISQPAFHETRWLLAVRNHHDTSWPFELVVWCTKPAILHCKGSDS